MPARHAVLLTPLECPVPIIILYSKQRQPITPLECALTSHSQLVENTATLSLVECALTRLSPATPLECAVPKNLGGGGSFFPFRKQSTPSQRQGPLVYPERSRPKIPTLSERATHHSPQFSSSFFSLSSALFPRQLTPQPKQPLWNQMFPHSLPSQRGCVRTASPSRSSNRGEGALGSDSLFPHPHPVSPLFCPPAPLSPYLLASLPPSSTIAALPSGGKMSFSQRFEEIRTGFERPFWVANITEIFERLSYYGAFASLANYLHEKLNFPTEQTGTLTGIFGGMVWFLAIFGGAIADRLGFRRALSLAYLILAVAYFLLGSLGAPWLAPVRAAIPPAIFVGFILVLPALGVSLVKPCVVGTTARASKENVRSIGYSIYYTMVNIGGAAGPYVASWAHRHLGVENVFRVAALSVFAMFFAVLIFFREPKKVSDGPVPSVAETLRNFFTVLSNPRFMLFLLIFTGYWIVFWQQYITLPGYIHGYISAD